MLSVQSQNPVYETLFSCPISVNGTTVPDKMEFSDSDGANCMELLQLIVVESSDPHLTTEDGSGTAPRKQEQKQA